MVSTENFNEWYENMNGRRQGYEFWYWVDRYNTTINKMRTLK